MIFDFASKETSNAYLTLLWACDGTEKCVEEPDLYTENWTGRPIPNATAERLCKGCHVIDECLAYALLNPDETTIMGGTTSDKRKELRGD